MSAWQPISSATNNMRIDALCREIGTGETIIFDDVLLVGVDEPYAFIVMLKGRPTVYRPHENGMVLTHWRPLPGSEG